VPATHTPCSTTAPTVHRWPRHTASADPTAQTPYLASATAITSTVVERFPARWRCAEGHRHAAV